jgi:hypothetical protein
VSSWILDEWVFIFVLALSKHGRRVGSTPPPPSLFLGELVVGSWSLVISGELEVLGGPDGEIVQLEVVELCQLWRGSRAECNWNFASSGDLNVVLWKGRILTYEEVGSLQNKR